ncbi:MAG: PAS domain S-box protein, partial [Methanotrichaceae archaeon]
MISSKADSRSEEITEHKLAEEALRAERDRAEKYLNIVEVIIVALDTQARITLLNRKGHQVLGYEEGELIGKDWIHTCLRPQDHRSVHEVNRKINAGEIQAFEYYENYVLTKKGEERFIAWHTTILKDDNSRIIGTLSSGEDITERKLAEENAKESEEKYRQLVENSLMGIGLSKGNQVIFANSALLRIFGYDSLEEFLKNPLIDPVAPESRELIATRKREISEGKSMPSVFEYTILRKDGTTRILRTSSSSITLGGKIYKQTTFQDITEQKQAEEALRESENKYRAIFENTGTATVIVEDDTTISLANSEFGRLTGYSREEIEGKMSWTEFVVKEDLEKMLRQHKLRRTDQAAALKSYEFRIKDRNGNIKDILLNIDIIPGTKKRIASLLDITERKRAEEELKRTQSSIRIAMDLVKLVRWEYDVETDLFTFDDQFYALYGTTAEREGGPLMSSQDYARKFIPAEEASLVAEEISKALATTDPNFTNQVEHRIIRADGTEGFIAVRFAVVKDDKGRTIKTYGANQDITERKLAEKALKDSERTLQEQLNFLQQLIDSIPNPIFYKDTKGVYLGCNAAFETITGYCKDKIVGHTVYELYPKEFADVYYEADNKLFQNPGVQIYEASMAHTDGSRHDVMFNKA